MRDIILSINPKWYEKIKSGKKTIELRKKLPLEFDGIYIYVTAPVKKIVGILLYNKIIYDTVDNLHHKYIDQSGCTSDEFKKYFNNHQKGYGIDISGVDLFDDPIPLKNPPQNYKFV